MKNNTDESWANFKNQRNLVNSMIKKAKRDQTQIDIDRINNMTDLNSNWWKLVKLHFTPDKETIPAL